MSLQSQHRELLEQESGISADIIEERGYQTVTTKVKLARLGFSALQCNTPSLLIPIFNPTGEVALYQARPDTPRINKGKKVKYETPTGARMVLDVHPRARGQIRNPNIPLFITEGVKKGDALVSRGNCAVALIGVWNWRGTNGQDGKAALPDWEFVALNSRQVYIVFDSDVMLKKEVHGALVRLKAMLELKGAKVAVIYLPSGDGAIKQGVDDFLAAGHSVDELLALATSEVRGLESEDSSERVGPYLVKDGAISQEKSTRDGPVVSPLCNFTARITEQRERDDGVERTLTFVISGTLTNGRALPAAEVTATQFGPMNWPVGEWGTQAVVYAGQGIKDHLRTAIQMLSGDVPRRTTYTHLGWREVDGVKVFLHGGGVIGPVDPHAPVNVQVEPPQGLEPFILPEPPTGEALKQAIRSSLGTLDLAPDNVTIPLLGMVYRAVLGGVDFGGHLAGQTGAGKSELAALMQQHYGADLDSRHLPGSWSSTANALEGLAFAGKDVLVTVDDFAPEGSSHDVQRYHATAARLFRAQGNNAARGRMQADGRLRPNKPPRGLILSTGEDIPKGHSIKARALILELEPNTLNWSLLSEAQSLASNGVYASAMAGFISWLAQDYDARVSTYKSEHAKQRQQLQNSGHKRTVDAGAQLLATYRSFLGFALETNAITEVEYKALRERVEVGVRAALEPQASLQAQSDPAIRFTELLSGLFVSLRAHVVDASTGECPGDGWGWEQYTLSTQYGPEQHYRAKGARIGWIDGDALYLEPSATYAELQQFARDQGETMPVSERTLWKRLSERGFLLSREEPHLTVKRSLPGGNRPRVLHMSASGLAPTGASGASGVDPAQRRREVPSEGKVGNVSGADKVPSETTQNPPALVAPQSPGVEPNSNSSSRSIPSEVKELHRLYRSGQLKGRPLDIPGGKIPDLDEALKHYFTKARTNDAERQDLLNIARAVISGTA